MYPDIVPILSILFASLDKIITYSMQIVLKILTYIAMLCIGVCVI